MLKIAIQAIAAAIKRNAGTGDGINADAKMVSKEMKKIVGTLP